MTTTTPAPDAGFVASGIAAPNPTPLCSDCLVSEGLCVSCGKSVLPQLAQPHWYRLIGTPLRDEKPIKDETPAVLKAKRRVAKRLERAMNGEFTRSTKAAA